ncbi:MAG: DNA replication protein DnaC [Myxococcota bacterium]|jgi:DNA replication protein DnaC
MRSSWTHPSTATDCPQCHGAGYAVVRTGAFARAEACGCVGPCIRCDGSGMVRTGTDRTAPLRRCACRRFEARLALFDGVGIPARHHDSTRGSFRATSSVQSAALVQVSRWVQDYTRGAESRGLVLYGDVGRGKTHLMAALLREVVLDKGASARFVEFSHLLADLKQGFDVGQGTSALLGPLSKVDVLGIDELGKGRNTEFEGTVLDELVSRRYNAGLPILATTNFAPGAPTGQSRGNLAAIGPSGRSVAPPVLADRVGDRVYSRLREMCDFVPLRGDDWRERRHAARRSRRPDGRSTV